MKKLWSWRWLRYSLLVILLFVAVPFSVAWYFQIWSWRDIEIYKAMKEECHPVWHDLYWGRIHPGDDVEHVIFRTRPMIVERFDNYVSLSYQVGFTGVGILAKDGKVVRAIAGSCTWEKTFFDKMTPEEREQYYRISSEHWKSRWEQEK